MIESVVIVLTRLMSNESTTPVLLLDVGVFVYGR
jgi:hypothetical protein